ncbi:MULTISPECIES: ABC transporter permease [unclassified Brachybacterium]|uniref:ABC transporter permease n=1 Tax=unclassified Brachybacterium TaxID=2623841 RepID=UPI00361F0421
MSALATAIRVEGYKAWSSRVVRTATLLVVGGIAVLVGALVAAARAGNQQILAQLGPLADAEGWELLTGVTAQITAAGGLLAFGVVLSWTFGREFAEGTITGLFAIPAPRAVIALAKLIVHLAWVGGIALVLSLLLLATGLLLRLGPVDGEVLRQLAEQAALTFGVGLLGLPAAWAATVWRGQLAGIAVVLGVLIAVQVTAIAAPGAAGAAAPFAAVGVPLVFAALTCRAWSRLQLDR